MKLLLFWLIFFMWRSTVCWAWFTSNLFPGHASHLAFRGFLWLWNIVQQVVPTCIALKAASLSLEEVPPWTAHLRSQYLGSAKEHARADRAIWDVHLVTSHPMRWRNPFLKDQIWQSSPNSWCTAPQLECRPSEGLPLRRARPQDKHIRGSRRKRLWRRFRLFSEVLPQQADCAACCVSKWKVRLAKGVKWRLVSRSDTADARSIDWLR